MPAVPLLKCLHTGICTVLYCEQVLLKWNLQRGVVVIPKASSEGHLRENLEGMFKWKLTNEQKVGVAGEGERERWGGGGDAGRGRTAEEHLARLTLAVMSFRVCCLLGTECDADDKQRIGRDCSKGWTLESLCGSNPNPACPHLLFTLL